MKIKKIIYNSDYVEDLKDKGNHKKAAAYMVFLHDTNLGIYEKSRAYSIRWNIGNTTAFKWIKNFNDEINKTDNFM